LLKATEGDHQLAADLIDIFRETAPPIVERLRTALRAGDHTTAREAAHALQGSAANLRAERMRELAHRIEMKAREGELEGAATFLAELDAAWAELEVALANAFVD
jgi:HPt (histidine-containing phosphotransfer) domain-containing protein